MELGDKFKKAVEDAKGLFDSGRIGSFKKSMKEATETISRFGREIKQTRLLTVAMGGAFMGFGRIRNG